MFALHARVANEARVRAYLQSDRRQAFADGVYRHYAELDAEAEAE